MRAERNQTLVRERGGHREERGRQGQVFFNGVRVHRGARLGILAREGSRVLRKQKSLIKWK